MLTLVQYWDLIKNQELHQVGVFTSAENALRAIRAFEKMMAFEESNDIADADFLRTHGNADRNIFCVSHLDNRYGYVVIKPTTDMVIVPGLNTPVIRLPNKRTAEHVWPA